MGRLKGWAPDIVAISGTALPTDGRFRFVASDRTGRPWVTLLVASWRPRNGVRFKLLKRVFDLDLQHCPNCGGELRIIAAILEPSVIEKILTHLGCRRVRRPGRRRGEVLSKLPDEGEGGPAPGLREGAAPGAGKAP